MRRKAGKDKKMGQENSGQAREEALAVSSEVAVIADSIHDLADAIRMLAQAQMSGTESGPADNQTLD